MRPKTLLEMAGASATPPSLAQSVVVVIDAQREYVDGALPLSGVEEALSEIAQLLRQARAAGAPVIHVKHRGRAGGAFDPNATRGDIVAQAAPAVAEPVIEKLLPNAFSGTDLKARLDALGHKELILSGFMTHLCIEATARSALDHGFKANVIAAATATRDLPDPTSEGTLRAAEVQRNALAALSDRFALIVPNVKALLG
jgi:nicotinamidase-related amidase